MKPRPCIYCDARPGAPHHEECPAASAGVAGDIRDLLTKPSPAEPHMAGPSGHEPPKSLRDEWAMILFRDCAKGKSPAADIKEAYHRADIAMEVRKK